MPLLYHTIFCRSTFTCSLKTNNEHWFETPTKIYLLFLSCAFPLNLTVFSANPIFDNWKWKVLCGWTPLNIKHRTGCFVNCIVGCWHFCQGTVVYDLKVMSSGGVAFYWYFLLLKDEAHVDESKCCLGFIDDGNNVFKHTWFLTFISANGSGREAEIKIKIIQHRNSSLQTQLKRWVTINLIHKVSSLYFCTWPVKECRA